MEKNEWLAIEVAYAKPEKQVILSLQVAPGCTLEAAIKQSGILELFPEIDLLEQTIGIFSQPQALTTTVQAGDRIEIYRSLFQDPKEARKLKAKKEKAKRYKK